ncbi:MAG: hypothetical protein JXR53_05390 [Bacteroidales bacterium]|jgi:hypothetical protein|nr:hypothetical protein [Bacteroidales bacterium]
MVKYKVLGILIKDRIKEAGKTQGVLSKYGNIISLRLGTHELSEAKNSRVGMIVLTLTGDHSLWPDLEKDLQEIGGIEVKDIEFNY